MPSETSWFWIAMYLACGFVLLAKGADWLVGGSSQVARRLGVSVLVVGLTVVAFGTSAPEIVVSGLAAWEGKADISLGNVLGSNIANIGLVLGACALVLPQVLEKRLASRELLWLFLSLAILWWIAHDGAILRIEAAFLLMAFVIYNGHLFATARQDVSPLEGATLEIKPYPWLYILVGIVGVSAGAKLVVMGAEGGALRLGVPASVVGLTVVSIGTSLPELAAGLGGALKGESDISLGNVVGSNVFNLLAVIGIVGLLQPLDPAVFPPDGADELHNAFASALGEDLWVVLAFSLAAALLPFAPGARQGRLKGALLLVAYLAYVGWLYASR